MGALHIVGHDFELWFGIHPGAIREQQAAAELGRIGLLGSLGHLHRAIEHTAARAIGHHFVDLVELPCRAPKRHQTVGIGELLTIHHLESPQAGLGRASALHHPGLQAHQPPTRGRRGAAEGAARLLFHGYMSQQAGHPVAKGQNAKIESGVLRQQHLRDQAGAIGSA